MVHIWNFFEFKSDFKSCVHAFVWVGTMSKSDICVLIEGRSLRLENVSRETFQQEKVATATRKALLQKSLIHFIKWAIQWRRKFKF